MGANVVRLRRRRIIDVAAYVKAVIIRRVREFGQSDSPRISRYVLKAIKCGGDLLDMLGTEIVLRPPRVEFGVGVDEEHLAAASLRLVWVRRAASEVGTHHKDASRDARAIEEI